MKPPPAPVVQRLREEGSMAGSLMLSERKAHDPAGRGYHAVYREHEVNHCPGCGRTHWLIGRMSAECAFCATALPLAEASMRHHSAPVIIQHKNRHHHEAWAA